MVKCALSINTLRTMREVTRTLCVLVYGSETELNKGEINHS